MAPEFPWYALVTDESLEQGDLINGVPILMPSEPVRPETGAISGRTEVFDVVVMSHTCDIENEKLAIVVVCAVWSLDEFSSRAPAYRDSKLRERIRRGYEPGLHLLAAEALEGKTLGPFIVQFRPTYTSQVGTLKEAVRKNPPRLRLLHPYREQLSQAFGRHFMRVGLPQDIPAFASRP